MNHSAKSGGTIYPFDNLREALPCDRPIKCLQIVEKHENCSKNFHPLFKTFEDENADLWREKILIGKRKNTRYLCYSKTEGFPNHVLHEIKIIGEKDSIPSNFLRLSRTSDTDQKALRKKQIVYKLSKQSEVNECITDIICSKFKNSPEGFTAAGDIDKLYVFYKLDTLQITEEHKIESRLQDQIDKLKLKSDLTGTGDHYYEMLDSSYRIDSISPSRAPLRQAPAPPVPNSTHSSNSLDNSQQGVVGTLSNYYINKDLLGVPFILHPKLRTDICFTYELNEVIFDKKNDHHEYNFQNERQILCATKGSSKRSSNPFFN